VGRDHAIDGVSTAATDTDNLKPGAVDVFVGEVQSQSTLILNVSHFSSKGL
jgi:phenylpyruvate tautomerase PptA (4-oxalocrotonate tautomerase family)